MEERIKRSPAYEAGAWHWSINGPATGVFSFPILRFLDSPEHR